MRIINNISNSINDDIRKAISKAIRNKLYFNDQIDIFPSPRVKLYHFLRNILENIPELIRDNLSTALTNTASELFVVIRDELQVIEL